MSETILKAEHIFKSFKSETGNKLEVLTDLSLNIEKASITAVVGSSGSGKSTLLHILGGLDQPDSGKVFWKDQLLKNMNLEALAGFRNKNLGFVFQFHHLLPEFTALENVAMPALICGHSFDEASVRAKELLNRFGIGDRAEHRPTQLSGGEQQRVSMARALMNKPEIILADEPTGNLDDRNTGVILDLLFELRKFEKVSILLITHEMNIAKRADHIYELIHGNLNQL